MFLATIGGGEEAEGQEARGGGGAGVSQPPSLYAVAPFCIHYSYHRPFILQAAVAATGGDEGAGAAAEAKRGRATKASRGVEEQGVDAEQAGTQADGAATAQEVLS